MNGWRYDWVDALPRDVYETLIAMLLRETGDQAPAADDLDALLQTTE